MRRTIGILACMWLAGCDSPPPPAATAELPDEAAEVTLDLPPLEQPRPAPPVAAEPAANESAEAAPDDNAEAGNQAQAAPAETAPRQDEPPAAPAPEAAAEAPTAPAAAAAAGADEIETVAASGATARMQLLPARPREAVAPWAGHIRRAGFECGGIASARQLRQPDGRTLEIYKIDCESGGSYQGTVRQGRLKFRRWTGRLDRR
ncbi:MAG TPA: hypothetical protein VGW34_13200 [Allosphingosinicella sp.]|nr:hypothetical protein [Allosphingosinicella sp.]